MALAGASAVQALSTSTLAGPTVSVKLEDILADPEGVGVTTVQTCPDSLSKHHLSHSRALDGPEHRS
jgi:hypothetical protein